MTGWSNGAAMAELYALNTPSIAAVAVYWAPAPFSDTQDPCSQTPFATTLPPIMDVHNACDIIGTCQTSTAFHQQLAQRYPDLQQNVVIVDSNAERQPTDQRHQRNWRVTPAELEAPPNKLISASSKVVDIGRGWLRDPLMIGCQRIYIFEKALGGECLM